MRTSCSRGTFRSFRRGFGAIARRGRTARMRGKCYRTVVGRVTPGPAGRQAGAWVFHGAATKQRSVTQGLRRYLAARPIGRIASEDLGVQVVAHDLGGKSLVVLQVDSTAANGVPGRSGAGRIWHISAEFCGCRRHSRTGASVLNRSWAHNAERPLNEAQ